MATEQFVRLEKTDGGRVARIAIRRPPVNVLRVEELERLGRLIGQVRGADVLLLEGLPGAFSAGVDVAEHAPEPDAIEKMLSAMRLVLGRLIAAPAVTLARVSGVCLGGAAEIVAACDLVYAAEDARIGFPEIRLACFPPGAAVLLSGRIGDARANDWILTGRIVSGSEAERVGFAARSFPSGVLARETERLVSELLSRSPQALAIARDLLRRGRREALVRDLARAEEAYRRLVASPDLARAVQEFGEN